MRKTDVSAAVEVAHENLMTALGALGDASEYRAINHDGVRAAEFLRDFYALTEKFLRDRGVEVVP